MRRRLRTGLSACVHRGALGQPRTTASGMRDFPRGNSGHESPIHPILTQGIFKVRERPPLAPLACPTLGLHSP